MIKLIMISDTHNKHDQITKDLLSLSNSDNDKTILFHAGDISMGGTSTEIYNFLNWFGDLPFKYKCFIAGNHDWGFETMNDIADEFKEQGIIYLKDQFIEIEGLKIYGSPWQPKFFDWAFNVDRGEPIAKKWEIIPENLDILMVHGPVHGILDYTPNYLNVGCEELYKRVMIVMPKIFINGHIHFARSVRNFNGIEFINASCLNEQYQYTNKPIVIHYDNIERKIIDYISM